MRNGGTLLAGELAVDISESEHGLAFQLMSYSLKVALASLNRALRVLELYELDDKSNKARIAIRPRQVPVSANLLDGISYTFVQSPAYVSTGSDAHPISPEYVRRTDGKNMFAVGFGRLLGVCSTSLPPQMSPQAAASDIYALGSA